MIKITMKHGLNLTKRKVLVKLEVSTTLCQLYGAAIQVII